MKFPAFQLCSCPCWGEGDWPVVPLILLLVLLAFFPPPAISPDLQSSTSFLFWQESCGTAVWQWNPHGWNHIITHSLILLGGEVLKLQGERSSLCPLLSQPLVLVLAVIHTRLIYVALSACTLSWAVVSPGLEFTRAHFTFQKTPLYHNSVTSMTAILFKMLHWLSSVGQTAVKPNLLEFVK